MDSTDGKGSGYIKSMTDEPVIAQVMAAPHLDLIIAEAELEVGAAAVLSHVRPHWHNTDVTFKVGLTLTYI